MDVRLGLHMPALKRERSQREIMGSVVLTLVYTIKQFV
jgi:hypothetical protein